jgi:hypothetical protein
VMKEPGDQPAPKHGVGYESRMTCSLHSAEHDQKIGRSGTRWRWSSTRSRHRSAANS